MAWTYGFFNSVNGDRLYNANQMSHIFEGLITDGVYESVGNKLAVQPNSGMAIQIATGRGWFAKHWVNNDSEYITALQGADVILNRYCAVCIRVDENDNGREATPYLKYSEFATAPVKPLPVRSERVNEYILAYIYIKAGATEIKASDIEDTRQNRELCGWVVGLIDQITPDTLYTQFTSMFNEWFSGLQDIIDEDVETTLVDALPKNVEITLSASDWVNDTQDVLVTGMNSTKTVLVQSEDTDYFKCNVSCTDQTTNTLTFTALKDTPDRDINIKVTYFGV